MKDLEMNHLCYAIREMYLARKQAVGQDNATERSWRLTAAAHADEVVCRVRHCDPDREDRRKVTLWKDRSGVRLKSVLFGREGGKMKRIQKPKVAKARHPLTGKWQIYGASAAAKWLVDTGKAERMSRATVWRIAAGCAAECGIHSRTAELVLKHFPAWR